MNRLKQLGGAGQAVWLDYIRRDILENGELARRVAEDGVTGVTSNPAIFGEAIGGSDLYDAALRDHLVRHPEADAEELYEVLAFADIRAAADILRPVWEDTEGADGYVSLEVSPHLAHDTEGTLASARDLFRRVDRPNLMIKVPATPAGIPCIETLLAEGIHVNVTLMFSLAHYEAVAGAYLRGVARAPRPERVASVASFFVSRVDSKVDPLLTAVGTPEAEALLGTVAIDNSKMAYRRFRELFHGDAFADLRRRGVRAQRVLWASTSTKNPAYRDVVYVEQLIGPETVNTMPPQTLEAFRDHGEVRPTLEEGVDEAERRLVRLASLGIDLDRATEELQEEGVEKFSKPFDGLLSTLAAKRGEIAAEAGGRDG